MASIIYNLGYKAVLNREKTWICTKIVIYSNYFKSIVIKHWTHLGTSIAFIYKFYLHNKHICKAFNTENKNWNFRRGSIFSKVSLLFLKERLVMTPPLYITLWELVSTLLRQSSAADEIDSIALPWIGPRSSASIRIFSHLRDLNCNSSWSDMFAPGPSISSNFSVSCSFFSSIDLILFSLSLSF